MSEYHSENYVQLSEQMLTLWTAALETASSATSPDMYDTAIDRLMSLRKAIAGRPLKELQRRHQQSFLTLIDDTVLWVKAMRDGGDVEATAHDLDEAYKGMAAEALRLSDDVRRRRAADPEA